MKTEWGRRRRLKKTEFLTDGPAGLLKRRCHLQLLMNNLMPETWYTLELTTNFARPVMYIFPANSTSETWPVLPEQRSGFFRLYYTP